MKNSADLEKLTTTRKSWWIVSIVKKLGKWVKLKIPRMSWWVVSMLGNLENHMIPKQSMRRKIVSKKEMVEVNHQSLREVHS